MKKFNVAILGATGMVGQEMIKILEERDFPISNLRPLASKNSSGKKILFCDKQYTVEEANENSFKNIDIVLGAVGNGLSKMLMPYAVKEGAIVIDNSSAYRLDDDVPLIIPEINEEDLKNHKGIISNPNCSTIIALVALNKLNEFSKINRIIVSTYQAVSGAGIGGINELKEQIEDLSKGITPKTNFFQYQIAYNLIPQIGSFVEDGYTQEEMKMQNEGRKILHNEELRVNCTCVRVPVFRSHSESITIETEKEISVDMAKKLLKRAEGIKLVDDKNELKYPMPLETSNQDLVYVGRIRKDISKDNSLSLWCCGDQIRKGAATNAVQIAEALITEGLV
ncbi:aspartate-semialdehyde dehydrogenase [Sedimentibacter sp. zth1]|uniref:aspartate-semialdehyde dehydrogenase n=1 Tax=Sedimentibacter sp. zth1 TaxID=2816908 RepID=UPI001A912D38|nr:aspartate-semialdehyde dehydrogenase [Sedimentibacter sp. zth1]QSX05800.1 aspartate-semialdehyde dehydrogenase [Sedimentibacter sp. zth1]